MITTNRSLFDLTAADLMSRDVVTIDHTMSLRVAAHLLRCTDVTGAPVVDERGRCVGMLSAVDFLRWAEEEGTAAEPRDIRTCSYQTQGHLLTGQEAVICTLAEGVCPLQVMQPTTDGRRTAICQAPHDFLSDWQQGFEHATAGEVGNYMTADVVTVKPGVPLAYLARVMIDAHIHRVVVTDEDGRPIGIVSATDVLAAVVREEAGFACHGAL